MKPYVFGVDLGGTTAKLALFTTEGVLQQKWEIPTDKTAQGKQILPNLAASINATMREKNLDSSMVEGVGIGVPGPVLQSGFVQTCANLGGWGNLNVPEQLSTMIGNLPVKVANDANVAALGEYWVGGAKGYNSVALVTLGTGVGGGVIINGQIIAGGHGAAGEIGHITVNRRERATCGCGKKGCLEQYSSATGVVRGMKRVLAEFTDASVLRDKSFVAKDVFDAAKAGDTLALLAVDDMAAHLAHALSTVAETIDPDVFLVGGGVSRAGDFLIEAITRHYRNYSFFACLDTPIKVATLGNDAGIYGAARLILG